VLQESHAAADPPMSDRGNCQPKDWAAGRLTLIGVWGVPATLMLLALLLEPAPRTAVWTAMLVWMGCACLANARRCGRTHCRYTGPFFLGMAALVVAHAAGVLALGGQPWAILGILTLGGNALVWWASERFLGIYSRPD
jgi:hypothetical protein